MINAPPPVNPRVRPRAGSLDGAAYPQHQTLSGPGAPPPAKKIRTEHADSRRNRRPRSPSPSNASGQYPNGQIDNSPLLQPLPPGAQPQHHQASSGRSRARDADRDGQVRYLEAHNSRGRNADPQSRGRQRSRSRSRASSASLDEMLLEATTGDDPDRRDGEDVEMVSTTGSPHGHSSRRHRSASIERDYEQAVQYSQGSRSRGLSSSVSLGHQSLHPSASIASGRVTVTPQGVMTTTGPGVPGSGPLPQPGQVQTYQTHIFAPPVTGAPVKKTKQSNTPSNGSLNVHVPAIVAVGRNGIIIGANPQGGGFPPVNAQGQRICRQCGLPGRYKDGKCVEKWGPGPEGPGTVCDRCRKKMKRVERRGTLESQQLAPAATHPVISHHHPTAALHASSVHRANSMSNGRSPSMSQTSERTLQRSDTVLVDQGPPIASSSRGYASASASNSHLISPYTRTTDRERERDRERARPHSPPPSNGAAYGRPHSHRTPPTPPHIATLPGSSTNDVEDDLLDAAENLPHPRGATHSRGSRAQSREREREPRMSSSNGGGGRHSHRPSPSLTTPSPPIPSMPSGDIDRERDRERGAMRAPPVPMPQQPSHPQSSLSSSGGEADVDADADADADADMDAEAELDGDAEAEGVNVRTGGDADADLLEAVDAAEANNATGDEE
ncbi:hypothetical protein BXZ70DRAFT_527703 [Cristinia sonorae]|uniref:Uncharacterized protein n=1 Tax=Cristinia sonorae TaxID=1940300 RepID=A0A8K0XTP9_9AGAR|nr:hypothetical protein BXZ70DRAFT_527703 [Cristinia sonorae]